MMRRIAVAATVLALAAGLTACGASKPGGGGGGSSQQTSSVTSGGAQSGSQGGATAKAVTVEVKDFSFTPGDVTLAKGGTVTWKFEDNTQHNVAASNNKFKSKDIQKGTYKYRFNSAGTYDYICTIHQYMKGTITVQ